MVVYLLQTRSLHRQSSQGAGLPVAHSGVYAMLHGMPPPLRAASLSWKACVLCLFIPTFHTQATIAPFTKEQDCWIVRKRTTSVRNCQIVSQSGRATFHSSGSKWQSLLLHILISLWDWRVPAFGHSGRCAAVPVIICDALMTWCSTSFEGSLATCASFSLVRCLFRYSVHF
jgi:hypothetical protein